LNQDLGSRRTETLLVLLLLVVFTAMEFVSLEIPGMLFDVLHMELLTLDIMKLLDKASLWELVRTGLLPAGQNVYHGALISYLLLPFFSLFGPHWLLVRAWPVAWAVFSLLLSYLFVRDFFDKKTAFLAILFLILSAPYVMGIKTISDVSIMHCFAMGALLCMSRYINTRRPSFLAAGMFLLGLGLCTRLWFAWLVGALAATAVFFSLEIVPWLRRLPQRLSVLAVLAVGSFLAGAALNIYRDVSSLFAAEHLIFAGLSPSNYFGPARYFENIFLNIRELVSLLHGREFFAFQFGVESASFSNPLTSVLFGVSLAWGLLLPFFREAPRRKQGFFVSLLFLFMFIQTPVSPSSVHAVHLLFLYPLVPVILASTFTGFFDICRRAKLLPLAVIGLLILDLSYDVRFLGRYFHYQSTVGGVKRHSDQIYHLADWFRAGRVSARNTFFLEHNTMSTLRFLLPDLPLNTPCVDLLSPTVRRRAARNTPPMTFIFNHHGLWSDKLPDSWRNFLSAAGRTAVSEKQFCDADGTPVFDIYTLR